MVDNTLDSTASTPAAYSTGNNTPGNVSANTGFTNWNFTNPAAASTTAGTPQQANNGLFQTLMNNGQSALNFGNKAYNYFTSTPTIANQATTISSGVPTSNIGTVGSPQLGFNTAPSYDSSSLGINTDFNNLGDSSFLNGGDFAGNSSDLSGIGNFNSDFSALGSDVSSSSFLSSAGNILGAAGTGFGIGSLNIFGGNSTGSSIGGAVGGIGGSLALGGLTTGIGAALAGTELGATIGSVIPGVGTVIGALAGSALGSLFGGGTPHPASTFGADLGTAGTFDNLGYDSKHQDTSAGQQIAGGLSSYFSTQAKDLGVTFAPGIHVDGGYDPGRWGNSAYLVTGPNGTQTFTFDPSDQKATQAAQKSAFDAAATLSGYDPSTLQSQAATQSAKNTSVSIPQQSNPSQWQQWLANYRQQHGQ